MERNTINGIPEPDAEKAVEAFNFLKTLVPFIEKIEGLDNQIKFRQAVFTLISKFTESGKKRKRDQDVICLQSFGPARHPSYSIKSEHQNQMAIKQEVGLDQFGPHGQCGFQSQQFSPRNNLGLTCGQMASRQYPQAGSCAPGGDCSYQTQRCGMATQDQFHQPAPALKGPQPQGSNQGQGQNGAAPGVQPSNVPCSGGQSPGLYPPGTAPSDQGNETMVTSAQDQREMIDFFKNLQKDEDFMRMVCAYKKEKDPKKEQ